MNRNPSIAPLSGLGRASASWMAIGLVAVSAIAQPSVTTDPKSQSVSLGAKVTLQVRANGTAPLSYQWRFQESDLPGANRFSLVLTNVQLANAGAYAAVVTDGLGASTTSQPAILDVDPAFTKVTAGSIVTDRELSFACAWEDYDRDGFLDLLVGNGGIAQAEGRESVPSRSSAGSTRASISRRRRIWPIGSL